MALEKSIYLICPVRNASEKEKKVLGRYVKKLENKGYEVHYPPRDVNQNDESGLNIMLAHRNIMEKYSEIYAYWNPKSEGSVCDLGMALMAKKPLKLINRRFVENWLKEHPGKSYTRVAYELHKVYSK